MRRVHFHRLRVRSREAFDHARIAERVLLDPSEIEELGDTFIWRERQLAVYVGRDDRFADGLIAVLTEELGLERQAEQTAETEGSCVFFDRREDGVPNPGVQVLLGDGKGAHLAKVLPHHVQRSAPDNLAALVDRDAKLLHGLVQHHEVFSKQDALVHERFDELLDRWHIRSAGSADGKTHGSSLGRDVAQKLDDAAEYRTDTVKDIPEVNEVTKVTGVAEVKEIAEIA
jgi:hypothetical protein